MTGLRECAALLTAKAVALSPRSGDVSIGRGVLAFGLPLIAAWPGSRVEIGDGVRLVSSSRATPLGVNHRAVIRTLRPGAHISIGAQTGISGGSVCAMTSVVIGARCLLGANVTVFDTDFHPVHDPAERYRAEPPEPTDADAVVIGDQVFIGTGAIIMKGVRIGADSVVGAGSVVTADCEPGTIIAGNPARPVGRVRTRT